jgi:hypothetical protein
MGLGASLILYLLVGAGVAFAVALADGGRSGGERFFRVSAAVVFWPLFVPLLLSGSPLPVKPETARSGPKDEIDAVIARADEELAAALASLRGWAEHVLKREGGRIEELRAAWKAQAERIREMDGLLARPDVVPPEAEGAAASERVLQLERARRINRERLRQMRRQAHEDLLANLAWVRELASMIHLAKFSGEPAARAEELVARLAAAIEGITCFPSPQR